MTDISELGVVCLADVESEQVKWLWPGRIPLGKLTVLEGDPKTGKSTVALDLAARVSTGGPMPDGGASPGPRQVILMTAEDGLADTVRPRLDAAGADTTLITAWESVPERDDEGNPAAERPPSLPRDLGVLEDLVVKRGAALVIVDVLNAYLGSGVDGHKDQDVRRALMPLTKMAARTGAAVLVLRHLNKSGGNNALYRGGGSIGIAGAARSILLAAPDPEDESGSRRVLALTECNVGPPVPALGYRVVADDERGCASVEWGGATRFSSSDLLATDPSPEERTARGEARRWLADLLSQGPVRADEAKQAWRVRRSRQPVNA